MILSDFLFFVVVTPVTASGCKNWLNLPKIQHLLRNVAVCRVVHTVTRCRRYIMVPLKHYHYWRDLGKRSSVLTDSSQLAACLQIGLVYEIIDQRVSWNRVDRQKYLVFVSLLDTVNFISGRKRKISLANFWDLVLIRSLLNRSIIIFKILISIRRGNRCFIFRARC